jgi:ferric-dicitrate binding protein FerR (iron transport regulator)
VFRGVLEHTGERQHEAKSRRGVWLLGGVATGALAAVLLLTLMPHPPAPRAGLARLRDFEAGPGVRAFVSAEAQATYEPRRDGPWVKIDKGMLIGELDRSAAPGPLQIATPYVRLVVRGTRFYVRVENRATEVGVERGHVDVQDADGSWVALAAGSGARVERGRVTRVTPEARELTFVGKHFDTRPDTRPAEAPTAGADRAAPVPVPTAAPETSAPVASSQPVQASSKKLHPSSGHKSSTRVRDARREWRHGRARAALDILDGALRSGTLDTAEREESLYLSATIHRSQREFEKAVSLLGAVAGGSSLTARLARLERADLLAYELDRRQEAIRDLETLLASDLRDDVAEQGRLHLCGLLIEERKFPASRQCLTRFLGDFPNSTRDAKARDLLRRVESLTQEVR